MVTHLLPALCCYTPCYAPDINQALLFPCLSKLFKVFSYCIKRMISFSFFLSSFLSSSSSSSSSTAPQESPKTAVGERFGSERNFVSTAEWVTLVSILGELAASLLGQCGRLAPSVTVDYTYSLDSAISILPHRHDTAVDTSGCVVQLTPLDGKTPRTSTLPLNIHKLSL